MALIFPIVAIIGAVVVYVVLFAEGPTDRGMMIALPFAAASIGSGVVCAFHVGFFG